MSVRMTGIVGWAFAVGALCVAGCADQEAQVNRLTQENAALSQDMARLQRERSDCTRELDKVKKELASAQAELDKQKALAKAVEESAARDKQERRGAAAQDQAMQALQAQITAKLDAAQRDLAQRIAQSAAATERAKVLEEQVAALSTELEQARAALAANRKGSTSAPRRSD
jgi:chromosome segregation ATPase